MTRTKLCVLLFVFVLAAALLPQALVAQAPERSLAAKIKALSATHPSAAQAPERNLAARIDALSATHPSAVQSPQRSLAARIEALSATHPAAGSAPAVATQAAAADLTYGNVANLAFILGGTGELEGATGVLRTTGELEEGGLAGHGRYEGSVCVP